MTAVAERLHRERAFHDAEARGRAATFAREPQRLRFAEDEYLDHQPWVRPALAMLGDVRDQRILDLGCGHGMASVVLARHGAQVSACDLSPGYVAEARRRALANGVRVEHCTANAECLPFVASSFDAIWGHAVLHHLDVVTAISEVRRVLRPGGIAVFCEPWAGNPLVRLVRRWRRHTADERALSACDIAVMREAFAHVSVCSYQYGRYVVVSSR